ncbi:hypothetical protein G8770_02765 [Aestuariicella hydrocarbonica]|uniref:Sulfotransferase domain-containing protein n=1 Tax=Pseudomaricurvus hydrocarbonicus TaxID=1470433 RepID=A0A9E5JTY0_9GAMM|nr:hypothetical protein [Aestuariicella hydrocarbonica]NHO64466.1 hypothetical protein [Aestuariicella hydrocarbonica]
MKKLILHIGCEKTGSTSIQNFLNVNRGGLERDNKILLPTSLGKDNHIQLAVYACDEDKGLSRFLKRGQDLNSARLPIEEKFRNEVLKSNCDTVLISNEWLHSRIRSREEFSRLKCLFENLFDDVTVIMYVRRQDKMAISLYSTSLKSGNHLPFQFPVVNPNGRLPYYYDFFEIYKNWAGEFGPGNVRIRFFERCSLKEGDVVKDFICSLGINNKNFKFLKEKNTSLSNLGVSIMRVVNRLISLGGRFVHPRLAKTIRGIVSYIFSGTPALTSSQECAAFNKKFSTSNTKLKLLYEKDCSEIINIR